VTVHAARPIPPQDKSRELQRKLYLRAKRKRAFWSDLMWQVIKIGMFNNLKAPGRRLSESRMREKPHVRFEVAGDENQT